MAVTRTRGKPPTGSYREKPKGRLSSAATKKRSPPAKTRTTRASKVQKTVPKANSGKRVNGGASISDAFVISDSENEDADLQRHLATDGFTPPSQTPKIDSPGSKDETRPMAMPTPSPTPTHSNKIENELVRMKVAHKKELQSLQLQLSASKAKARQIKEDAEQNALDLQRRQVISSDKRIADWEEKLEMERGRTSDLMWECDYLQKEIEAAHSSLQGETDLVQQRDEYAQLYKKEQATNTNLTRKLEEKNEETSRKTDTTANEIQDLAKQIDNLQRETNDLRSENATLRLSTTDPPSPVDPKARLRASPTPSISSTQLTAASDVDPRLINIRKTYITVKRRYDNLRSVAANISTASRSWDYARFGEFGAYLEQLKNALEGSGVEEQGG